MFVNAVVIYANINDSGILVVMNYFSETTFLTSMKMLFLVVKKRKLGNMKRIGYSKDTIVREGDHKVPSSSDPKTDNWLDH